MLFDLRGRGRRRTVQVIYLSLAVLMGGGLVLFGIGGATSGGLVDGLIGGGGGGSSTEDVFHQRADDAQTKVTANPADAAAWGALARAEAQLSQTSGSYDEQKQAYTADGMANLRKADQAWQRYLKLTAADKVDDTIAIQMVNVYLGLDKPADAVAAQEYVVDRRPEGYGLYATLSQLAYAAHQNRKGDLAAKKAVELAPEADKETIKSRLEQAKAQASGATDASGEAAAGSPTPSG